MSGREASAGSNGAPPPAAAAAAATPTPPDAQLADVAASIKGHEPLTFVAPSSYLRSRGHSRSSTPAAAVHTPMMTALDREQLEGLVSVRFLLSVLEPSLLVRFGQSYPQSRSS